MGGQTPIQHAPLGPRAEADGPGRGAPDAVAIVADVEAATKRDGRERTAHLIKDTDLFLDIADKLHSLQKVERACLLVDPHEDFHRHERTEVLLQPVVVLADAGLGGEQPHELHAALDLGEPIAHASHHEQTGRSHQAVVLCDPLPDAPPRARLDRLPGIAPFVLGEFAQLELRRKQFEGRRHERDEDQEADHDADGGENAEHSDRHQLAHSEGRQTDRRRARRQRERQQRVVHSPARSALHHTGLGELVAVVVGQMDRAAGRGHIDQRRHRQQDGVDGIARVPDDREAGEHAVDARRKHHRHQRLALEAPPTDEEPHHQRQTEENRHARLAGTVDRHVVDGWATHVQCLFGNPTLRDSNVFDQIDGTVQVGPGRVGECQHEAGLPGIEVVGLAADGNPFRGRADDRPSETGNRLPAIEVQRLLGHPFDRPGAGLGRLEKKRPLDPRGFFRRGQQFLGEQFQPGVGHGAAIPTDQNELLSLEVLSEKAVGLGFGIFEGQPALHVVAVISLGFDRPHDHQWQQENQDRHDPDAVPLVEVRAGIRHHAVQTGQPRVPGRGISLRQPLNRTGVFPPSPYRSSASGPVFHSCWIT